MSTPATTSKYLVDEQPLIVLPTLARALGLTEAVILQQINWMVASPRSGRIFESVTVGERVFEGRTWVWNTAEQWQEYFTWLEPDTIRKHLASLESKGVLVSTQVAGFNRTKYYTIDYDELSTLIEKVPFGKTCRMESEKNAASFRHALRGMHSEKDAGSSIKQIKPQNIHTEREPAGAGAPSPVTSTFSDLVPSEHPAVKSWIAKLNPMKKVIHPLSKAIAARIGNDPADLAIWDEALDIWEVNGWNPNNAEGLINRFDTIKRKAELEKVDRSRPATSSNRGNGRQSKSGTFRRPQATYSEADHARKEEEARRRREEKLNGHAHA